MNTFNRNHWLYRVLACFYHSWLLRVCESFHQRKVCEATPGQHVWHCQLSRSRNVLLQLCLVMVVSKDGASWKYFFIVSIDHFPMLSAALGGVRKENQIIY